MKEGRPRPFADAHADAQEAPERRVKGSSGGCGGDAMPGKQTDGLALTYARQQTTAKTGASAWVGGAKRLSASPVRVCDGAATPGNMLLYCEGSANSSSLGNSSDGWLNNNRSTRDVSRSHRQNGSKTDSWR